MRQSFVQRFAASLLRVGSDPADTEDVRLQKALLLRGTYMFLVAGFVWGVLYFLWGEPLPGAIPFLYALFSAASVLVFGLTRRYKFFVDSQLALILILPFMLMVALGGFINASGVILWALICPLGALLFSKPHHAPRWFVAFLLLVTASGFLQPMVRLTNNLRREIVIFFFVANISGVSTLVFVLLHYFVGQKNEALRLLRLEQDKSERLLLNVLPSEIAATLKNESGTIAESYDAASILFADVVGFTPLSATMAPTEMVDLLNEVFSHFDSLVDAYGVEKIRTIGDSYMVAAGVPRPRQDHAQALAGLALDMCGFISGFRGGNGQSLDFRVGINSGPVVAGVIGRNKFHYDVWGDAVNIASRMESHGKPGKIQITRETYELLKDEFVCEARGRVDVKGKGRLDTWYVVGRA